ncbi:hypothetical protein [Natrinema salaciae]|uniref:Uncharacterized protein n=1 Tax=Natrinema salaciae TaxID=1186196 RepID=A0A1H9EVK2_9EURY|nr:hypothetical protein [Natrinema salaciae]SEQ29617.1 hypothetical protein SAMN04489841_1393 [Natrinema salaciae]
MAIHSNWTYFLYENLPEEKLETVLPAVWGQFRSLEEEGDQYSTSDDSPSTGEKTLLVYSGQINGTLYWSTGTDLTHNQGSPDVPQLKLKVDSEAEDINLE